MFKKLILPLVLVFSVVFLVSCEGASTTGNLTTGNLTTEEVTTEETTTPVPTTTEEPTIASVELPDLSGELLSSVESQLTTLGLSYDIQYVTDTNQTQGLFIEYGNGYLSGDMVQVDETVIVKIYTSDIYLPDLSGMTQTEILNYFFSVGIVNFNFTVVNDNTVEDSTFSGYENHEIGDQLTSAEQIIVFIAFNDPKIPDLTGLIKRQVVDLLDSLEINYDIVYATNDAYIQDEFAYYENATAGDFYDDDSLVVEVVLWENTFTYAEKSLMISKYVDSETDSAIELYNPTDASINLSDYHIAIYSGGSYEVSYTIPLTDVALAPGETFLITSTNTEPNLQRFADIRTSDLMFDGVNDTIQLVYKNGTYIDTIYQIGDRGSDMDNETFVRRADVVGGSRSFSLGEWTAFVPGYYDIIGTHPLDIDDTLTYSTSEMLTLTTRGFYSALGGMDLVEYRGAADGDTAYFYPGFMDAERVRFIGNDTPETSPAVVDEPEPWGLEAKHYTMTILEYADSNNKNIYVQSDPDIGYTEGYGRHLGIIWVDLGEDILSIDIEDSSGNVLFTEQLTGLVCINYQLVKNGFSADEYSSTSGLVVNNRYMYRWFDEAERFAKANHLGIHEE